MTKKTLTPKRRRRPPIFAPGPAPAATTSSAAATSPAPRAAYAPLVDPFGKAPTVTIPAVPRSIIPTNLREFMGYRPTSLELLAARAAIQNLETFTEYRATLGPVAPDAAKVADALRVALAWRDLRKPLEALVAYVRYGDADAWKTALKLVEELKPLLTYAVRRRGAIADQIPALVELVGVAKQTAARANVTKKKKAKAKADAAAKEAADAEKAAKAAAAAEAKLAKRTVTITT